MVVDRSEPDDDDRQNDRMCDIGWKAPLGVDERRITGDSLAREGVPLSMSHARCREFSTSWVCKCVFATRVDH